MDAAALDVWQGAPYPFHFVEDLVIFGIIGHGMHSWTGKDQVRVQVRNDMLGEAAHHAERVLQSIPTRNLNDDGRIAMWQWAGTMHVAAALDAS